MEMSLLRLICDNKEFLRTLIEVLAKEGHFRHVSAELLSFSFAKFSALLQAILDHKGKSHRLCRTFEWHGLQAS